mgnify:CR=1 FL=1
MITRRDFLKSLPLAGVALGSIGKPGSAMAGAPASAMGCLVDTSICEGCGRCEHECAVVNDLIDKPKPICTPESRDTPNRRTDADHFTVVNHYDARTVDGQERHVHVKIQCMHCLNPSCVSACIVGAITRDPKTGAVSYDASKCIGCRYCMVACPFGIPAYEYLEPLTPRVRKCTLCFERLSAGQIPACAEACPRQAITYGKREDLLKLAKQKIEMPPSPGRQHEPYVDKIYGENEVGGTAWLYLAQVPFGELGFLDLPDQAPPRLTENIQHGVFKHFVPPVALFALLGAVMYLFKRNDEDSLDVKEQNNE